MLLGGVEVAWLVVAHAVDHVIVFEIDAELAVVPARDRRLADGLVLLIGEAEALQYRAFGLAFVRQVAGIDIRALAADRNGQGVGERGKRGEQGE